MLKLIVDDVKYKVEFRHLLSYGRRPALRVGGEIKVATLCVVTAEGLIAMDMAACDAWDNFSRREGRWRALKKVLERCSPLRTVKRQFLQVMLELDPEPTPIVRVIRVLSPEERAKLILAGVPIREMRARMRGASA